MIPIFSSLAMAALVSGAPCELPCRCLPPRTPVETRNTSSAVFVGRVISQRDSVYVLHDSANNHDFRFHDTEHTMVVEAAWKLPAGVSDTIRVWTRNTSCSPWFEVNGQYMVYVHDDNAETRRFAYGCSRSRPLSNAAEDVRELGRPTRGVVPAIVPQTSAAGTPARPG